MPEEDLAPHAGVSYWRGSTRINDTSIGIELENRGWQKTAGVKVLPLSSGTDCGSDPLARDIIARYHIAPQNVVAHADIAPQRKDDPLGPLFPATAGAAGDRRPPDEQRVAFISTGGRPASQWTPKSYWICSRAMAIR